jgi:hypothetical protein
MTFFFFQAAVAKIMKRGEAGALHDEVSVG